MREKRTENKNSKMRRMFRKTGAFAKTISLLTAAALVSGMTFGSLNLTDAYAYYEKGEEPGQEEGLLETTAPADGEQIWDAEGETGDDAETVSSGAAGETQLAGLMFNVEGVAVVNDPGLTGEDGITEDETETETESESESESETETEPEQKTQTAEYQTETEAENIETEAAEEITETETESETTEIGTEDESESETVNESQNESETETETEILAEVSETESESEISTESESESDNEAILESESETETEVLAESETEAEIETESEMGIETEYESESETENESEALQADQMIEIIEDDVNLRAEPTTDAEVVAVVAKGTRLELLGTVTAADAEWYQVVYTGTELIGNAGNEAEEIIDGEINAEAVTTIEDTLAGVGSVEPNEAVLTTSPEDDVLEIEANETVPAESDVLAGTGTTGQNEGVVAYVRSDLAKIAESESAVITRYHYQDENVDVLVTLTNPADLPDDAELVVTPVELTQEAEEKIQEDFSENVETTVDDAVTEDPGIIVEDISGQGDETETETEKADESVLTIHAYDIKFMQNGQEIQPGATVKVEVTSPEIRANDTTAVYHVDENNEIENMGGEISQEGIVEFEAPHFSTYVIVQQGSSQVKVTIEHYDNATDEQIYSTDVITLPVGGLVNDYAKATNWDVVKVNVNGTNYTSEDDYKKIEVSTDTIIKVYYTAKTGTVDGAVRFYDYTVKAGEGNDQNGKKVYYSINQTGNYSENASGNRLTAGTTDQNYSSYATGEYDWNGNKWSGNIAEMEKDAPYTGLLKGLDTEGNPVFNYAEPGFFKNEDSSVTVGTDSTPIYLRKVYSNYTLQFSQSGDTYTLSSVKDGGGEIVATAQDGKNGEFFPLDKESYKEGSQTKHNNGVSCTKTHNYYFGMRYDVNFTLGDYTGALEYSFTGDDDLWVVLDGNNVVIDLGGIHNAATQTVNLWDSLKLTPGSLTEEQKNKEHTLTILYMERGAGASNCQMKFTLPSARIAGVTNVPMTSLILHKINSKGESLEGAKFKLVEDATGITATASSLSDGTITFTKLREGTYTLTETQAPDGYIPSLNTWKVQVTIDGDNNAIANLYLLDGTTEAKVDPDENGIYKILNMTEQERINSSMDYDKTATVKDWDERTYDINITASSKLTSTTTTESGGVADVMMVLDTSGSMLYNGSNSDSDGFVSVGKYSSVNSKLDTTKVYYYGNGTKNVKYSQWSYTNAKCPMIYRDGEWIYYDSGWKTVESGSKTEIYTLDSRLTGLKEAAITFTTSTASSSSDSKLGIATFNSVAKLEQSLVAVGANEDTLVKTIAALTASGGTSPGLGLEKAYNELTKNKRADVKQYVILFTDGDPSEDTDKEDTEAKADLLKQEGIYVYTVGLKLKTNTKQWLEENIASEGCAYEAGDIDSLKEIFKTIQQTMTQNLNIKEAQITDVIDERFVIVDANNQPVANGTVIEGGTVHVDENGNYSITWTEQTIPNKSDGAWSRTITVKAKDDYIGGNAVPTNVSPDSKITTGYGDAVLPQPTVNVKAELEVGNKEVTIYKGDSVPTEEAILNSLFTTEYIGKHGVTADDFTLAWYTDEACTQAITREEMAQVKPENTTKYYLQVTYNAGEPTDESTGNTGGNVAGGEEHIVKATNTDTANYPNKEYGVYTIKVISGEIQITKKLEKASDTEQEFSFVVTKDGQTFQTVTIKIPAGKTSATYNGEALNGLARGTYVITESDKNGYAVQQIVLNNKVDLTTGNFTDPSVATDCKNEIVTPTSATFVMGNNLSDSNVISTVYEYTGNGIFGGVLFTNEEVIRDWQIVKRNKNNPGQYLEGAIFKLVGVQQYYGKSGSNGVVEWYIDEACTTKLTETIARGTYTLTEMKAPSGYVMSEQSWTIEIANNGALKSIRDKEQTTINGTSSGTTIQYFFDNVMLYELPSTGGHGIYWYLISGVLLMMAAALIIYKNKCREVLNS